MRKRRREGDSDMLNFEKRGAEKARRVRMSNAAGARMRGVKHMSSKRYYMFPMPFKFHLGLMKIARSKRPRKDHIQ